LKGDFVNETETIRTSFRPQCITTLFVGESAPHGGKFFYRGNSQAFRYMKEALCGKGDFLAWFKAQGYFLDDLILRPANKKTKKERRRLRWKNVPSLAERLSVYRPAAVIALMIGIEPMVRAAIAEAGMSDIPFSATPFPGNGQQGRFKSKMAEIIPKPQP
jgi:hypothetical protein